MISKMYKYNSTLPHNSPNKQRSVTITQHVSTGGRQAITRGDLVAVVTRRQRRQEEEEENERGEGGGGLLSTRTIKTISSLITLRCLGIPFRLRLSPDDAVLPALYCSRQGAGSCPGRFPVCIASMRLLVVVGRWLRRWRKFPPCLDLLSDIWNFAEHVSGSLR